MITATCRPVRAAVALAGMLATGATSAAAQAKPIAKPAPNTAALLAALDGKASHYGDVAKQIWGFAEVGYMETKSSALLQSELKAAGFTVKAGVAGEPTAFVAEYGSGSPSLGYRRMPTRSASRS
jgi:aminobenzoyl-glutamate utilization protein B